MKSLAIYNHHVSSMSFRGYLQRHDLQNQALGDHLCYMDICSSISSKRPFALQWTTSKSSAIIRERYCGEQDNGRQDIAGAQLAR